MTLRVNVDDLACAASAVAGHGEDVAVAHTAADGRIGAAQAGWQGRSAAALADRAAQWSQDSRVLLAQLDDHAQALRACAHDFREAEQRGTVALEFS